MRNAGPSLFAKWAVIVTIRREVAEFLQAHNRLRERRTDTFVSVDQLGILRHVSFKRNRDLAFLRCGKLFPTQPRFNCVNEHLSVHRGQGFGERNSLWTRFHAVLCVVALCDAARPHQCIEPGPRVHGPGGMHVEQTNLAHDCSAHKTVVRITLGQTSRQFPQVMQRESG
jgi:hypothetical protein